MCMCNEYHILGHIFFELTIIFHFNEPIENPTYLRDKRYLPWSWGGLISYWKLSRLEFSREDTVLITFGVRDPISTPSMN